MTEWKHRLAAAGQAIRGTLATWFPPASRRRAWIGAAIAVIGAAGLLLDNWRLEQAHAPQQTVEVATTTRPLAVGHILSEGDLSSQHVPVEWMHPQSVRANERHLLVGRVLTAGAQRNEVLLYSSVADPVQGDRMSQLIRPGERAVALSVNAAAAVGYYVRPGDRVDLFLATRRYGERVVSPVLENVAVLATGDAVSGMATQRQYDQIVVSVTPKEAELLLLADDIGQVRLLLRNADDLDSDGEFGVLSERELFGTDVRRDVQRSRNARIVRVIKGS